MILFIFTPPPISAGFICYLFNKYNLFSIKVDVQTSKLNSPGSDNWGLLWLQCVSALRKACQQTFVCPPVASMPKSLVMLNLVMSSVPLVFPVSIKTWFNVTELLTVKTVRKTNDFQSWWKISWKVAIGYNLEYAPSGPTIPLHKMYGSE